jgi:hypothetical protein
VSDFNGLEWQQTRSLYWILFHIGGDFVPSRGSGIGHGKVARLSFECRKPVTHESAMNNARQKRYWIGQLVFAEGGGTVTNALSFGMSLIIQVFKGYAV